jgi:hypothetical protein
MRADVKECTLARWRDIGQVEVMNMKMRTPKPDGEGGGQGGTI